MFTSAGSSEIMQIWMIFKLNLVICDYIFSTVMNSLTRLMYCTTSLTNDLLISSFSLWGEFYPQSIPAELNLQYLVTSSGHTNITHHIYIYCWLSMFKYRCSLFCHVLVFRFGFVDLLLPFLVHFLLDILLFPTGHETEIERMKTQELSVFVERVCSAVYWAPVLLLTDVSELFELSTLALLCDGGQLLNQLETHRERVQGKVTETGNIRFKSFILSVWLVEILFIIKRHSEQRTNTITIMLAFFCLTEPLWRLSCAGELEQKSFIFPHRTTEHVRRQHGDVIFYLVSL